MKKIFNWIIGSMFRTFGRFIGLLLISCLFGFILIKSGFKISDLISIEKVYAAESLSWTTQQSRIYYDQQGTEKQTSWQTIPYTQSLSYPATQMQFRLQYSGGLKAGNTYKFKISYLPNPDSLNASGIWFSDGTNTLTQVNCSGFVRESNNYYANICAISPEVDISSSDYLYVRVVFNESYVDSVRSWVGNFDETKGTGAIIQDSAIDIINNQNDNTQSIIQNQIQQFTSLIESQQVCKTIKITREDIEIDNNYLGYTSGSLNENSLYGISKYFDIGNESSLEIYETGPNNIGTCFYQQDGTLISCVNTNNIINITIPNNAKKFRVSINKATNRPQFLFKTCINGAQGTTDAINDLNNSINDSDSSGASSDALDFFNNFNDNSHGLASIITTPLNSIRLMLSDTCVAPHTIYKGQTISLPCGSILWSRPGADSLKDFLNLVYGGLLSYYLVVNLLSLVNDFKNPDNDKIEVTDL